MKRPGRRLWGWGGTGDGQWKTRLAQQVDTGRLRARNMSLDCVESHEIPLEVGS